MGLVEFMLFIDHGMELNDEVFDERDDFLHKIEDLLIYWEYSGCHEFPLFDCFLIMRNLPVHQQTVIEGRL